MSRFGLALSGGGFRATLYHLGVLRFLRDAGLLCKISHITAVSGGSVTAAHLVLNWDRYNGTDQDYDNASKELLDFIRLDVRNRVVRRFPLASLTNSARWVTRMGRRRQLTRPGLLESHYEKYLYGDTCLYELPVTPQLHILATNLNEGCLCSFTRTGLLEQRRLPDGTMRFVPVQSGLATVPMAVTASSAFPGFFPPLQLTAADVGAEESRFPPHLFTDGGVYDNLGVRMFRHIQDSWIGHDTPLQEDDFVDLDAAVEQLSKVARDAGPSPIATLARLIRSRTGAHPAEITGKLLPLSLWNVITRETLYQRSSFESLVPRDEHAADLLGLARRGRKLEPADNIWLNRCLVEAAFADIGQGPLLVPRNSLFDAVFVSDAGKRFTVSRRTRGGGLVGTALRSSDILMNRVWQLEYNAFRREPDFVFAPMSLVVSRDEDHTALHPEIQRQVANTRTDMDRFDDLEISGLIRHGYGVMRKVCREHSELFGETLPDGPPWDPTSIGAQETDEGEREPSTVTRQARTLQTASQRRIFSRLFDFRDWPSYIYLPLLLGLLIGVPWVGYKAYRTAQRAEMIVDAITFSNPDFQLVLQLARQNPLPGDWHPISPEPVDQLDPIESSEFALISDTRILDMRAWRHGSSLPEHRAVMYRRMRVRRIRSPIDSETPAADTGKFRFQQYSPLGEFQLRCESRGLEPVFRITKATLPSGEQGFLTQGEFNLSHVPTGSDFDFGFEVIVSAIHGEMDDLRRVNFPIVADTHVATMWVLLPVGRESGDVELVAFDPNSPHEVERVEPTYSFEMADGSMFGWMLVAPRDNHTYECNWTWRDP